jgi:leucyl aminopeptidase
MASLKGDMAGAATSLGAILYAAKNKLPINLVSILACCENMPGSNSLKPGDVITAMNGTTIEVIDTDAEGRLVLADALLYSQDFKSKYTIDMATLTGACVVALGHVHTGMFSEDEKLIDKLSEASKNIKDKVWQLPMEEDHEEMLDSKVADISNLCIGKGAGAQNGAIFLKRFAPDKGWCHLDIAGTSASKAGEATSRPMPLISEFLDNL